MKYLSFPTDEFDPPEWYSIRTKEKRCIFDEMHNHESEYGDVLFPKYYGSRKRSWLFSSRLYYHKSNIRNDYLVEIRNILNGFHVDDHWRREDYEEIFAGEFSRIVNLDESEETDSRFQWLNTRKVKTAVKNWNGAPVDILYYLVNSGIVEKAVSLEVKRMLRK
jgi:hypothetical protein